MLKTLSIKNFALLVDEEIEFGDKLNILTGETGAGKTIIVNALRTILGDRVSSSVLRDGATKAIVEGVFQVEPTSALDTYLRQKNLAAEDNQMILRREIHESRSRAFVNDTPVQLSTLQEIGELTVDLHGQHDHQSLLKVKSHLMFLDEFGDLESDVNEVARRYKTLQNFIFKFR
ncbi:MAG: AAA family ATPase [bacterium]